MKKIISLSLSFALASSIFVGSPNYANAASFSAQPAVAAIPAKTSQYENSYQMIRSTLLENGAVGRFDPSEMSPKEVGALIQQVVQENPEILYYKSANVWSDGKIEYAYYLPTETMKKNRAALNAEVDKVVASINKPSLSDFDKVKAVHDYLVLNTAYDYANQQKKTIPADSYTAHGALLGELAVCDGYTKAAQLLLNRLGIENHYVVGHIKDGLHSWNQVKLNGKYYFMDITWDDPVPNKPGVVSYDYFLVTSDQLRKDHTWEEKNWAVATDKQYSYFHDFKNMVQVGNDYFYSSKSDNQKLYKMASNGKNKKKVNDVRAPYFAIVGNDIYFSNYSNGGYLYKMKTDGTKLEKLNSVHSVDIAVDGNILRFTDSTSKKPMSLALNNKAAAK
ncbi:DUF5050 domain-containing protein [Sporosarcina sp. ACRSM]|uniref:DUF5050 domain-containing protein n=1 Tax=Sporosarcina sp. ACRSM TaxID=2918216 RepID=UPI001EF4BEF5|nr:DUF5050 domain-containing protein [Sporosarcina sp. ACRSM]MCG7336504.1 DUF5050 domain-containing protein [Sporosarcina sp. ACRSM]